MEKISVSDLRTYSLGVHATELPSTWFDTQTVHLSDPSDAVLQWYQAQGYEAEDNGGGSYTMQKDFLKKKDVLDEMMVDFNIEWSRGKDINEERYTDLMVAYEATLDKTEDELNLLEDDEDAFETIIVTQAAAILTDYSTHETDVDGFLDNWGDAERTRVDNQFDAADSAVEARMRAQGQWNTTLSGAYTIGSAREESIADTELEDKITQRQLELKERLYDKLRAMRDRFIAARNNLMAQLHAQGNARTNLRNKFMEVVLAFSERRNDDYPTYLEIQKAALDVAKMELH